MNRNEHPGIAAGIERHTQVEISASAAVKKAEKDAVAQEKKRLLAEKKVQRAAAAKELAGLMDKREQERQDREQALRDTEEAGAEQERGRMGLDGDQDGMDVDADVAAVDGKAKRKVAKCSSFHVMTHLSPFINSAHRCGEEEGRA